MKNFIFLIFCILLSGCVSFKGDMPKFPDRPEFLEKSCKELMLIKEDETKFSNILIVVTKNYGIYHECKIKNELWNEWYNSQRRIYEGLK